MSQPEQNPPVPVPGDTPDRPSTSEPAPADLNERMYTGQDVGRIVAERVGRLNKSHESKLAAVAEQAARVAAQRTREQADAEWGALLVDAGIDLEAARRDARMMQALKASAGKNRSLKMRY